MAPVAKTHFPVQQREPAPRPIDGLGRDRHSVLSLSAIAFVCSAVYAGIAPFMGPVPASSWLAIAALVICNAAALAAAYTSALRVAALMTVASIWLPALIAQWILGVQGPAAELFTVTVVFAALACGRRVATMVMVVSVAIVAVGWRFLPAGADPIQGGFMLRRRPLIDLGLLLFGSVVALWWSWRTERAALERDALAGNAEILETLQEAVASAQSGIVITSAAGVVIYVNRALVEMWRFGDPSGAVGRKIVDFWADTPSAIESLRRLSTGEALVTELRARRPDGSEFDVEISGSRIVNADGRVDGYIGSFIDVTERRRAEALVEAERERTRAIVESVLDIVMILDARGTIIFENAAVERVLGFTPGECVGQPLLSYAHPEDIARAGTALAELLVDTKKLARITVRFRHADGTWRWLEMFGRNLTHVPAIGGILAVARDVTEQRDMQARLDASERLETVGRLAGGIAHDFNNLLTAILGNAELARELPAIDGPALRYLEGVIQAGYRARDLTRKLLAFARREITQPVVIDLREQLSDARTLLRRILSEDIVLRVETGQAPLPVLMDPVHFEQVILNLAVNARDAMPSGGTFSVLAALVEIETVEATFIGRLSPGPAVKLTIRDSGEGMPPDVAARIFEPFFTTKELGRGTGLGLSTVYGNLAQAGGAIRVTSAVSIGTTFEILLPRADGPVAVRPHTPVREASAPSAVVLVAEDDPGVRGFMVEVLEGAGCHVLEAQDGVEGRDVVDAHPEIDLLVTDIVMPNSNGLELAAHFRAVRPHGRVLFVTGYSKDPTVEAQAEAIQALVLLKPFTVEQLLGHVRRLIGASDSDRDVPV